MRTKEEIKNEDNYWQRANIDELLEDEDEDEDFIG